MTRRITYDHSTITFWPSGKTHSGDRVFVKTAEVVRKKESMCSDGSAGPESLDGAGGGARSTEKSNISSWHYAMGWSVRNFWVRDP